MAWNIGSSAESLHNPHVSFVNHYTGGRIYALINHSVEPGSCYLRVTAVLSLQQRGRVPSIQQALEHGAPQPRPAAGRCMRRRHQGRQLAGVPRQHQEPAHANCSPLRA